MEPEEFQAKKKWIIAGVILAVALPFMCILPYAKWLGLGAQPGIYFSTMLVSRILFWVVLGVMFLYAFKAERSRMLLWKEEKYPFGIYIAFFFITFAAVYCSMIAISVFIRNYGFQTESTALRSVTGLLSKHPVLSVFTCLTAAVVEEFLFRGYLQPRLELLVKNRYAAIILTALPFALLHMGFGTLYNVLGPFAIGILFAIHYSYFRNLKFLIVFHFVWDILMLYLASRQAIHP